MKAFNTKKGSRTAPDYAPSPLRVKGGGNSHLVQMLMLMPGDTIVAVNGISWLRLSCVVSAVDAMLQRTDTPVVLTVQRGERLFDVITNTAIGNDAVRMLPEKAEAFSDVRVSQLPQNPRSLGSFEIYADMHGTADILSMRKSLMAMVCPPLWCIARRQWEALASLICVLVTAFVINLVFGAIIYVAFCLYIGRRQIPFGRSAMRRQGMYKVLVLAATTEAQAQVLSNQLYAQLTFKFRHPDDDVSLGADIGLL
jgi:hypothetical protein